MCLCMSKVWLWLRWRLFGPCPTIIFKTLNFKKKAFNWKIKVAEVPLLLWARKPFLFSWLKVQNTLMLQLHKAHTHEHKHKSHTHQHQHKLHSIHINLTKYEYIQPTKHQKKQNLKKKQKQKSKNFFLFIIFTFIIF